MADLTLGRGDGGEEGSGSVFETGHYRIWREPTTDTEAHGTEIKLLDLLPRTRAELASVDLWNRHENQIDETEGERLDPPEIHIGRTEGSSDKLTTQPAVPWEESDSARTRFEKLIGNLRSLSGTREVVDLRKACDNYFWTMWSLALSVPVEYIEGHPFDLHNDGKSLFFQIENRLKGQASPVEVPTNDTVRSALALTAPNGATAGKFEVFMDGVQILRPVLYRNLPPPRAGLDKSLLFIGRHREEFGGKPAELTGGPLQFEAYLFWAPRIVPKQHQGVVLRVGNASGSLFDPDFMGYQTAELTRKTQVTAEIFVSVGLDDAINIDRESFNYAHPHYQFLTKWLHSAFRQFSNRHKELGKQLRTARLNASSVQAEEKMAGKVRLALLNRGVSDVPEVLIIRGKAETSQPRQDGKIVLHHDVVFPVPAQQRPSESQTNRLRLAERKAIAITQLLHGMNLLDSLTFADQEKLIRDIMEIVLLDDA